MAWVVHNPLRLKDQPVVGEGKNKAQCATLAQWYNNAIPHTCHWKPGKQVSKATALIQGTVIATFNKNGDYPNRTGFHTALYVRTDANGIWAIEQYKHASNILLTHYRFGDIRSMEKDANNYYVVEHKHDRTWHGE